MDFNYRGSGAVDRPFMAPSEGSGLTRSWRREFLHRNRDHPLNVLTKLSAMPLLWGLQTGVVTGLSPKDRAMARVLPAM